MLAKPEYSSPPDEVCCWQGRCGGEAGRGAAAKRLAGALQRRAIGKMLLAVDTVTELLLAGALLQNSIGKQPAGQPAQKTRQRKGAAQNSSRRKRAAKSSRQRRAAAAH